MTRFFRLMVVVSILGLSVFSCVRTDQPETPATPDVTVLTCLYGYEGCTPGYWKNARMHACEWQAAGYAPTNDFDTVFGTNYFNPDRTLLEALNSGGGGYDALGRHAVAALLSASNADVNYGLTFDEVIAAVRAGNKNLLAGYNEMGCPLNNCKDEPLR